MAPQALPVTPSRLRWAIVPARRAAINTWLTIAAAIAALPLTVATAPQQAFRADVDLVTVTATVRDSRGRLVDHLKAENFTLYDDDVYQDIAHFSHSPDAPISVGILMDVRMNMARKMKTAIYAVDRFLRTLRPDDEIFLMTFADTVRLRQEFTTDHASVLRKLDTLDVALERPALSDGLEAAIAELDNARIDRQGVLVITDRQDESRYANADGFKIRSYLFGRDFSRGPGRPAERPAMDAELFVAGKSRQLDTFLDGLSSELRSQYTLAYYTNVPVDGRFHTIRLVTTPAFDVEARRGYRPKD